MNTHGNIALVGFMGTGKSACGKLVAKQLGHRFVDMDDMIEERAQKKISDIFAEDGERAFRRMEHDLAAELSTETDLVIAAGGGIVLDPENIRAFERQGIVVCLLATPEAILSRVQGASHRPLLEDGEKADRIRGLLAQRKDLYEAIPLQVDTTGLDLDGVAARVLALYEQHDRAT